MALLKRIKTASQVLSGRGPTALVERAMIVALEQVVNSSFKIASRARKLSHLIAQRHTRHLLRRNTVLNDRHQGKRAFVIATGPSLSSQDLSPLGGEITIAVNSFFRHPMVSQWNPTYYCCVDHQYFRSKDGTEGALTSDLITIGKKSNRSTFLITCDGEPAVNAGDLPSEQTYYLSCAGWAQEGNVVWPRLDLPIIMTWNVVQSALLIAMAMGCNPIYLLGCDHDWGANPGDWKHFYANADETPCDGFSSATQLYRDAYFIMKSYQEIKAICDHRGVKIFNATAGGRLDIFQRADLTSLF